MPIINTSLALLEDAILYLSKVNTDSYSMPIDPLFNGTLGKHTRHFIELFQCLLFQTKMGVVNYDTRKRNSLIETDKKVAIQAIKDIQLKF